MSAFASPRGLRAIRDSGEASVKTGCGGGNRLERWVALLAGVGLTVACATARAPSATQASVRAPSPCDPADGGAGDWTPLGIGFIPAMQAFDRGCNVLGMRVALFGSENWDVSGLDVAPIWTTTLHDAIGVQIAGGLNRVAGEATGVQIAAVNAADSVRGVQLGLVNSAKSMHGVQLGLLNFNQAGFLPVFPLMNVGVGAEGPTE